MSNESELEKPLEVMRPVVSGLVDVFTEKTSASGNGGGIGDLMVLLALLPGLKKRFADKTIRVIANRKDWLRLGYSGLVVDFVEYNELKVRGEIEIHQFERWWCSYDLVAAKRESNRHEFFGKHLQVEPQHIPIEIRPDALTWAANELKGLKEKHPKILGIFPYSTSRQREWPDLHWVTLIEELKKKGYGTIMIGGPGDDQRSSAYPCMRYWGIDPAKTVAMMTLLDACVGNDSGMAHVAAILGRPILVIGSATNVQLVFSFYKNARWIQAPGACSGCYWIPIRGFRPSCNYHCELMLDLKPSVVLGHLENLLEQ